MLFRSAASDHFHAFPAPYFFIDSLSALRTSTVGSAVKHVTKTRSQKTTFWRGDIFDREAKRFCLF